MPKGTRVGEKRARVLKYWPDQTGSSLDPHLFLDRVALRAVALETGFDVLTAYRGVEV